MTPGWNPVLSGWKGRRDSGPVRGSVRWVVTCFTWAVGQYTAAGNTTTYHMRLLTERPAAHLAHKRLLAGVDLKVLLEVESL